MSGAPVREERPQGGTALAGGTAELPARCVWQSRAVDCLRCEASQPKLYQHVLDCYLLSAHSYLKLEQYKTAIKNCETILRNERNHEALVI